MVVISVLLSVSLVFAMFFVSAFRTPSWIPAGAAGEYRRVNITGLVVSLLVLLCVSLSVRGGFAYETLLFVSLSGLTFLSFVSAYSDFCFRRVDRWLLRLLILFVVPVSVVVVANSSVPFIFEIYAVFMLVFLAGFFVPGIGASDVRALIVFLAVLLPLTGLYGFFCGFSGLLIAAVATGVVQFVVDRRRGGGGSVSLFTTSIPLVPLILVFALLTVVFC